MTDVDRQPRKDHPDRHAFRSAHCARSCGQSKGQVQQQGMLGSPLFVWRRPHRSWLGIAGRQVSVVRYLRNRSGKHQARD